MAISVFDLFKIGIGPSSSHTVGPMRAAHRFAGALDAAGLLQRVQQLRCDLYGSLAATGRGHGSDKAVILGLCGERPEEVDPSSIDARLKRIRDASELPLLGRHPIRWIEAEQLCFHANETLPWHPNGLRFTALESGGGQLLERVYYSVGGGFVVEETEASADQLHARDDTELPYPFSSMEALLNHCREQECTISDIMFANEQAWRSEAEIRSGLLHIWQVMQDCIQAGCEQEGILPGGLQVPRRAPALYRKLREQQESALCDPLTTMDWVNLYAIAVNEENAAGGRVVTAPTNGA
ncbi:MAG TPA: L-serine ammonia-lyase, partial [Chromatiaceae bacterium]|nr:L-serine ammonia-lyase [Chromatiaceae bacterium]